MIKSAAMNIIPLESSASCQRCHRAVCATSDARERIELDRIKHYRTYRPGEKVMAAGEEMPFVGSVVTGFVSLKRMMPDGRCQMVGLLFPSDFIGRPDRAPAAHDAEAVGEVTLCTFEPRKFEALLDKSQVLKRRLLEMTFDELDAAREWMLLLGCKTAQEKIASFIAMAGRRAGLLETACLDGQSLELPLSREDMAEYLGLRIETVSRQIGRLRKAGLIELESARRLVIKDYPALLKAAGDDSDAR